MLKLFFVIFANFHRAPYIVPKMRYMADHPQKYSEAERYDMMRHCIDLMNKSGKITTEAYGLENLPETGGYIMYPNHQGKYDLLGIITTHDKVLSFVMDKQKSHTMLVREFVDLVQAKRLEKDNPRQGLTIINEVARDVKNGKRYVLFPEGGYKFNNKNKVQDFKAGSFKIALKSHVPIIPIALIDSYKVFNSFHFGPVTTQVHYLKPIEYDEYKDMKTKDILKQALMDFDGTLIVVSHDRDFLDGLVTKVYEFGHQRVKEHLCGIYEFLETKKLESLQELERKNA